MRYTAPVALVAAALIALGATACSDDGDDVTSQPDPSSPAASTPAGDTSTPPASPAPSSPSTSTTPKKAAGIGDTITLKALEGAEFAVTLKAVKDPAQGADEYTEPGAGKRFMAVQLELVNTGNKAYSDSPSNGAQVADSQGQRFDSTFLTTDAGPEMVADMTLQPGGKALGWISFEVPKDSKIVQLQFALDSGFADQTGQWTLTK